MIWVETVWPVHTADVILVARGRTGTTVTVVANDVVESYNESAPFVTVTVQVPARFALSTLPTMKQPAEPELVTA
jgi:hypothetical protein